ncbi:lysophospholipid acyltransferase family protein [Candidatus Latescibacterota bacterium]
MNISVFLQASPNVILFKHAPQEFSKRYLRLLGKLYYIVNPKERDLIIRNIKNVFNDVEKSSEIIKKTFDGIFYHYSEKLIMAYRNLDRLKKEIGGIMEYSGLEHLDRARQKGGVVLVTGHFGAVEYMPLALHLRNYPVSMTVSFQKQQLKDSLIERAKTGDVELIDCHSDNVMEKVLDSLNRGRVLLTECDEVEAWKAHKEKTLDAFGGKIKLDRSLSVLYRRTKATVLCAFIIRTEKGYCMKIVPVGENSESKLLNIGEEILKTLEKFVMKFPDQWYQWKKLQMMRPEAV